MVFLLILKYGLNDELNAFQSCGSKGDTETKQQQLCVHLMLSMLVKGYLTKILKKETRQNSP